MKKEGLIKWFTIACILFICSCDDREKPKDDSSNNQPLVIEAMNFLKNKELKSINMQQSLNSRSLLVIEACNPTQELTPDWNTMQTYQEDGEEIRMFSLKNQYPVSGYVYTRSNGKVTEQLSVTTSKLVLWKIENKLVGRIFTYIPDRSFLKDSTNSIANLGYQLENSNFSGIRLVSSLDGHFIYGDKYDAGKHCYHFMPNTENRQEQEENSIENINSTEHIFFKLIKDERAIGTKATYATRESGGYTCSFCGRPADQCTCVTISRPQKNCPRCGNPIGRCICCPRCHNYPCTCNSGNSGNSGGTTGGGTTGGGTTGGGTTGGGTTGGDGDNSNTGNQYPDTPNKKTAQEIIDAAVNAVQRVKREHNNDMIARCNEGVRNAFEALFGSKELYNMRANDMTRYWLNHSDKWERIHMEDAQQLANDGYFVVAGWIAPQGSGHVVVIVPGKEKVGTWKKQRIKLPNVMDTGGGMRAVSQPISQSFGVNKHKNVLFFKYK